MQAVCGKVGGLVEHYVEMVQISCANGNLSYFGRMADIGPGGRKFLISCFAICFKMVVSQKRTVLSTASQ